MKTNLKRILALALTVLMVVGVVPMAIFATGASANSEQGSSGLDANIKFNGPTASDVKNVIYWNDFNSLTPGGAYAQTGEQTIFNGSMVQDGTINVLDDGNDGAAISISATGKHGRFLAGDKWAAQSGNSGKSIVLSADFKLPNVAGCRAASVFTPGDRKATVPTPILVDTDGSLYLGYVNGEILYAGDNPLVVNLVAGALPDKLKVGGKIGQLSADNFTNVAAILDVANNTFSVIIDGTTVADGLTMFSEEKLAAFASIGYANGFGYSGFHVMNSSKAASGDTCIIDNVLIYEGNTFEGTWTYGTDVTSGSVEYECVAPTADAIKAKYGDSAIIFYNNYNALTPGGDFSSAGGIGVNGLDSRTTGTVVSDGKGGAALALDASDKGGFYTAWDRWGAQTGNSGKNFVMATDIKIGSGTEGAVIPFAFGDRKGTNGSPLFIDRDGTIYLGHNGTSIMTDGVINTSLDNTEKAGGAIGNISAGKFTNLAVVINVVNNTMVVYIDGVAVTDALPLFTEEQKATFAANGFENGYGVCQVRMPACNAYTAAGSYVYDNSMVYWGDGYDATFIAKSVGYKAPTVADVKSTFGESAFVYFNDFNKLEIGATLTGTYDLDNGKVGNGISHNRIENGGAIIVSDGNGGSAVQSKSDVGQYNFWPGAAWGVNPANAGKSFVVAMDFKLTTATPKSTWLFQFSDRQSSGACAPVPVLLDTDGTLYAGFHGGSACNHNDAQLSKTGLDATHKAMAIGKLSTDKFTNVAVVVNVANNTFKIVVDGIDTTGNLTLFTEAQLDKVATLAYAGGNRYGWTLNQMGIDHNRGGETFIFDNLLMYWGDTYFELANQKGIFSGSEVQGNLNGYVPSNGVIKYYEDGALVKNTTSADGLLTIDENGVVKFGDKNVVSMDEIYTVNAKGELVPAAGVYNGFYTANSLLGVKGNDYYFDEDGEVVAGNDKVEVGDKFYEADASGVIKPLTKVETDAETGDKTYYVFGTKVEDAAEVFNAIPDGETYTLTEDFDIGDVEIATADDEEVTINLNGNNIVADYIVVTGNVKFVDTGAEKGTITTAIGGLAYVGSAGENVVSKNVIASLGADEENEVETYIILDVKKQDMVTEGEGEINFLFRPALETTELSKQFLSDAYNADEGALTSGLTLTVTVVAYDENGNPVKTIDLEAGPELLASVYTDNTKGIQLTITGYESYSKVVVNYAISGAIGFTCPFDSVVLYENV